MNIDQTLEQLKQLNYPKQVDVVDKVMAQVSQKPYLRPVQHRPLWTRIVATAAAAAVALLLVNVLSITLRSYDEAGMGNTLAQLNDYGSWGSVEEVALNPYESLYEEY